MRTAPRVSIADDPEAARQHHVAEKLKALHGLLVDFAEEITKPALYRPEETPDREETAKKLCDAFEDKAARLSLEITWLFDDKHLAIEEDEDEEPQPDVVVHTPTLTPIRK
jgi:hypothetical protein